MEVTSENLPKTPGIPSDETDPTIEGGPGIKPPPKRGLPVDGTDPTTEGGPGIKPPPK